MKSGEDSAADRGRVWKRAEQADGERREVRFEGGSGAPGHEWGDFTTEFTEDTEKGRSGGRPFDAKGEPFEAKGKRRRKAVPSHRTPYTGMGANYQRIG